MADGTGGSGAAADMCEGVIEMHHKVTGFPMGMCPSNR